MFNSWNSDGKLSQLLAVFTGTISTISDGMQYGWTAPVIPILESENTPVEIHRSDIVWLENIYWIGSFAGLPCTIYLVEKCGRKNSMLIAAVINLLVWILIAVASSVEVLYVARFMAGVAGDIAIVSGPMYIAEIADQRIRGFLGSSIYLMILVGVLVVYSVAPYVTIAVSSAVGACFLIFQLLTFPFMPESPYYLLLQNRQDDARKSLQRLRATEDVSKELGEITAAVERQKSERGKPIDLFIVKSNRKALIIMTILNGAQHFSSISVMLMNVHTILGDAASIIPPSTAAIIFSVIMLVAATTAAFVVDKVGRKILLSSSSFLTGVSLAVLASYFAVKNSGVDITSYSWIPVVAVMFYAVSFKYGLGIVPLVLGAELFPTSVKAMGMTLANVAYVVFSIISIYLYQFLADAYGMHVPFFIFAASCLLTTLFIIICIPETTGKTLEEIQLILKGNKLAPSKDTQKRNMEGKVNEAMEDVF